MQMHKKNREMVMETEKPKLPTHCTKSMDSSRELHGDPRIRHKEERTVGGRGWKQKCTACLAEAKHAELCIGSCICN